MHVLTKWIMYDSLNCNPFPREHQQSPRPKIAAKDSWCYEVSLRERPADSSVCHPRICMYVHALP